jgi:hypothetical protein
MKSSNQAEIGRNETRRVSEWSVGYRIAGPMIVFLALVLGSAQWVRSGLGTGAAEQPQAESTERTTEPAPSLVEAYRKTVDAAE